MTLLVVSSTIVILMITATIVISMICDAIVRMHFILAAA
jgi:hypothetical protein